MKPPDCMRRREASAVNGFTLLELVVVILIISIMATLVGSRMGTFQYWREENMIRRLAETITFLHHQAVADGVFYRLEFDLSYDEPSYRIGEIVAEEQEVEDIKNLLDADAGVGLLSIQLARFLMPSQGRYQNMIEPRSFPSLAKPVLLPEGVQIPEIRTMRGKKTDPDQGRPYIMFSPRGFSEFGVIHITLMNNREVTILINPFTGLTDIYREYKDFEWTYTQPRDGASP